MLKLQCLITNIITNPTVQRHAVSAAKNAATAIRAAVDSWNSSAYADSIVQRNRLGTAIYNLSIEKSIKGTLTQRTAHALIDANKFLAETRAIRIWGYVMDTKAVECLTSLQLRDIVRAIRACEDEFDSRVTRDVCEQLCNELLELADQKEGMKPEEAAAFGQPAAEEIFRRRFCAEAATANKAK